VTGEVETLMSFGEHLQEAASAFSFCTAVWTTFTITIALLPGRTSRLARLFAADLYSLGVSYPVFALALWRFARSGLEKSEKASFVMWLMLVPSVVGLMSVAVLPVEAFWKVLLSDEWIGVPFVLSKGLFVSSALVLLRRFRRWLEMPDSGLVSRALALFRPMIFVLGLLLITTPAIVYSLFVTALHCVTCVVATAFVTAQLQSRRSGRHRSR
jgi:hypothetical protein